MPKNKHANTQTCLDASMQTCLQTSEKGFKTHEKYAFRWLN